MAKNPSRVVIDTNVLISAIVFGGKPQKIFLLILEKKIQAVISTILLAELHEVINKKFPTLAPDLQLIESQIKKLFILVQPKNVIDIVRDIDDNRVLEAAVEGKCDFVITGDLDLLELKTYQDIKIVTPDSFLSNLQQR